MSHLLRFALCLFPLAISAPILAGCGATDTSTSSATVSAIEISPSSCTVSKGNSVQLTATATHSDGVKEDLMNNPAATWSVANTSTATVSTEGVVVGVNTGVTKVTVSYQGASGSEDCGVL